MGIRRALFVFFVISGALFPYKAYVFAAQTDPVDMSKIESLPDYSVELSAPDFEKNSNIFNETPPNDKFLSYEVRLPTGWEKSKTSGVIEEGDESKGEEVVVNRRLLGEISRYYGPGRLEEPSRFEVRAQGLEFDVAAKNWFMREALERGYTLEGLKVVSDKRIEALYVVVEKDTAFIVRVAAEINGPRVIVASYYVPEKFWMKERGYQQRAIESFRFLSPEDRKVEIVRDYSFLDLLTFSYPASWKLAVPAIYSVEAMEARLIRAAEDRTLNGEIHISIVSTDFEDAVEDEIAYMKEDLANRGLEVSDLIATEENYKTHDYIHYAHIEQYNVLKNDRKIQEYEFWIGVLEEDRYYYIVTLLTPGRGNEFFVWAQNQEVYKRLIESFRP